MKLTIGLGMACPEIPPPSHLPKTHFVHGLVYCFTVMEQYQLRLSTSSGTQSKISILQWVTIHLYTVQKSHERPILGQLQNPDDKFMEIQTRWLSYEIVLTCNFKLIYHYCYSSWYVTLKSCSQKPWDPNVNTRNPKYQSTIWLQNPKINQIMFPCMISVINVEKIFKKWGIIRLL